MPDRCQKCSKEIIWLKHHETRKSNPIEAAPAEKGNLVINRQEGIYRFATEAEIEKARAENKNLYISHFSSCPNAKEFRRK